MAVSNRSIPLNGKIQENNLLAFKNRKLLIGKKFTKVIKKNIGITLIGSVIAEIFNLKDTSKLLSQQFRTNFDQL